MESHKRNLSDISRSFSDVVQDNKKPKEGSVSRPMESSNEGVDLGVDIHAQPPTATSTPDPRLTSYPDSMAAIVRDFLSSPCP